MDTHHQFRTGRGMAPALITIDDPAQEFHFAAGSVFRQPFDVINVVACAVKLAIDVRTTYRGVTRMCSGDVAIRGPRRVPTTIDDADGNSSSARSSMV